MNIICIPYHDWRKIEKEGSRTRDSHIIQHLVKNETVDTVLVVNRPTTYLEIILKRKKLKLPGTVVFKPGGGELYKISEKLYVLDYISNDLTGPLLKKKLWFFESFAEKKFVNAFQKTIEFLNIKFDVVLTQNIFSAYFPSIPGTPLVFDAWDNFLLFPENKPIETELRAAYQTLAKKATSWITNSVKNLQFYEKEYNLKNCALVKNGVDTEVFEKKYEKPDDLKNLPGPIIGFGGKITHLFDYELFNYCAEKHKDKTFVIIGQIHNKQVFNNINIKDNVHYLGDKHYTQYPVYVTNFDIGIVPYVTDNLEHGADSIKVYEYIAAGLGVIGTGGAGMSDLADYIYVSNNKEEFCLNIDNALSKPRNKKLPESHTWKSKTADILQIFTGTVEKN